jgi:hypothetical protein
MLDHEAYAMLLLMGGAGPPVEYRAAASSGPGTSVTKPSGVTVGDLVLVWALDVNAVTPSLSTSGGSAWTLVDNDTNTSIFAVGKFALFAKVLTATDVANAWDLGTAADQGALAVRYTGNGATTVTKKTEADAGSNTGNLSASAAGFAKSSGHYGVLTFVLSTDEAANPTPPSGFTERSDAAYNSTCRAAAADNLFSYTDNAAVQWTTLSGAAGPSHSVHVLTVEITGP